MYLPEFCYAFTRKYKRVPKFSPFFTQKRVYSFRQCSSRKEVTSSNLVIWRLSLRKRIGKQQGVVQDPGLVAAGQGAVLTRRPEGAMGGSSYQNCVAEIAGVNDRRPAHVLYPLFCTLHFTSHVKTITYLCVENSHIFCHSAILFHARSILF